MMQIPPQIPPIGLKWVMDLPVERFIEIVEGSVEASDLDIQVMPGEPRDKEPIKRLVGVYLLPGFEEKAGLLSKAIGEYTEKDFREIPIEDVLEHLMDGEEG